MPEEYTNLPNSTQDADVMAYRAAVFIPLAITILCTVLDVLSKWKISGIDVAHLKFVLDTIISYFFPSILATALGMIWTHYFGTGVSGIKEGFGFRFSVLTFILFFIYMISLFFADCTWMSVVFSIILVVYLYLITKKCMDHVVLRGAGLQGNGYNPYKASGGK